MPDATETNGGHREHDRRDVPHRAPVNGRGYDALAGEHGRVWHELQRPCHGSHRHVPWSALTAVRSNARTVIFVRDRVLLGYLPASAFASPADQADIVRFARERIASTLARPIHS